MNVQEMDALMKGVGIVLREHIAPLMARIDELEKREPLKGDKGEPGNNGLDGKDAEPVDVERVIGEVLKRIPVPKDGTDGKDGKDAPTIDKQEIILAIRAMIPDPKDGKDGADGANGKDGMNGADGKSVTIGDVMPELMAEVTRRMSEIRQPEDGKSVTAADVLPDLTEHVNKFLAGLPVPQDGKSVTLNEVRPLFDAGFAQWALDFERRAADVLQRAVDRIPIPENGQDGADGLGFDDMDLEYDGERTFTFTWSRGEKKSQKSFKVPIPLYRGVYKSGDDTRWEAWDLLTYGGSVWRAKCDDPGPPGPNNPNWHLVVKKGADGKDAR